jgi:pheromone shutdown protein TraB
MKLTFRQRLFLLLLLAMLFFAVYGVARYYSPAIVAYVVEQTLIQKAPEGVGPELVRQRFEALVATLPAEAKLKKILAISSYLEKVQKLTPQELERLLSADATAANMGF